MVTNYSIITYRFASCKTQYTIRFEGNYITLWELRYEIISQRSMNSKDFELLFYDADTGEQYENDEYAKIMRNSNILLKRVPLWMAGNHFQMTRMLQGNRNTQAVPPDTYICYRCGQKGHFIQNCPTNSDKAFDQLRIKTPAGVPKDFLQKVGEDHVQAMVQTREWKRRQNIMNIGNVPEELRCTECLGILETPMVSSCGHHFCKDCVTEKAKCIKCKHVIFSLIFDENKNNIVEYFKKNKATEDNDK